MVGGETITAKVRSPRGRLAKLLHGHKPVGAVIEALFLATVSRRPSAAEVAAVQKYVAAGDQQEEVLADLFWALLNSKDFTFNH
jgi:hypothetical protein